MWKGVFIISALNRWPLVFSTYGFSRRLRVVPIELRHTSSIVLYRRSRNNVRWWALFWKTLPDVSNRGSKMPTFSEFAIQSSLTLFSPLIRSIHGVCELADSYDDQIVWTCLSSFRSCDKEHGRGDSVLYALFNCIINFFSTFILGKDEYVGCSHSNCSFRRDHFDLR